MQSAQILNKILAQYRSLREFARTIGEAPPDIYLWKDGRRNIHARAVISIVKHHPEYTPHQLNPDIFERGLTFNFNSKGKK